MYIGVSLVLLTIMIIYQPQCLHKDIAATLYLVTINFKQDM